MHKTNTMPQTPEEMKKRSARIAVIKLIIISCVVLALSTGTTYAALASGDWGTLTDPQLGMFGDVINWLSFWLTVVGGVIISWGLVQLALAIHAQSPDKKIEAVLVIVAGAMVIGAARIMPQLVGV